MDGSTRIIIQKMTKYPAIRVPPANLHMLNKKVLFTPIVT